MFVKPGDVRPAMLRLFSASGQEIAIKGVATVAITLADVRIEDEFVVTDDIQETILGFCFMRKHACTWDMGKGVVHIAGIAVLW